MMQGEGNEALTALTGVDVPGSEYIYSTRPVTQHMLSDLQQGSAWTQDKIEEKIVGRLTGRYRGVNCMFRSMSTWILRSVTCDRALRCFPESRANQSLTTDRLRVVQGKVSVIGKGPRREW
jgi:hypothetical protein